MTRSKTIEIDGQPITISMLSKRDADEIEATYRTRYWLTKKMEMLEIISDPVCPEQADWAKKEYDNSSMKFNDALSKSGFETVKRMLKSNPFATDDWLNDDNERFNRIEQEVSSFKTGNVPIMERAMDMLINHCKANATMMMSGQEVIDKVGSMLDSIMKNEDKKIIYYCLRCEHCAGKGCNVVDEVVGNIWEHPFRREMNDYMACVDDKGNIIHLPNAGGLLDQDDDHMTYIYLIQDEIRKYLSAQYANMKVT